MASRKADAKIVTLIITVVLAVFAGAVALPFLGARNIVRGYERDLFQTIFVTWLGNLLLIGGGFILCIIATPIALAFLHSGEKPVGIEESATFYPTTEALVVTAASIACGLVWGWTQRSTRLEGFAIARDNNVFLNRHGIRITGLEDVTHYDVNNNPLRYIGTQGKRMVFMAVGRRNRRAYIELDKTGRMTEYSGVVSLLHGSEAPDA